jgi:hypothetical protein
MISGDQVDRVELPGSASDDTPALASPEQAYIRNPIADRPMLTPAEAIDAIALLATTLKVDDIYRAQLEARTVPDEG